MSSHDAIVSDSKRESRRARKHLTKGTVTQNYEGPREEPVTILNQAVAADVVCVLRYKHHAVCASEFASETLKLALAQHAQPGDDEHGDLLTELIDQLLRQTNFDPGEPLSGLASENVEGEHSTATLIKHLFADRIAVEIYCEMVRHLRTRDSEPSIANGGECLARHGQGDRHE